MSDPAPIWRPDADAVADSSIVRFSRFLISSGRSTLFDPSDYSTLWQWSVDHLPDYWAAVWEFYDFGTASDYEDVLAMDDGLTSAQWFTGSSLNFAERLLSRGTDDAVAVIAVDESGLVEKVTWRELRRRVAALMDTLRGLGVGRGDAVVGYLPVGTPALVGLLASTGLGALWAQCAPDYAAEPAAARLGQVAPAVLIAADGYVYGGRAYDRGDDVADLEKRLTSVRHTVVVDVLGTGPLPAAARSTTRHDWESVVAGEHPLQFAELDFDTPLWALFTSGTTGPPKGIVHSHGGVAVALTAFLGLHFDLGPRDVFLQYTSTNWMMWNVAVAALLLGSATVLYDGSPTHPHLDRLWEIADELDVSVLGTSPGYLSACRDANLTPGADGRLARLRLLNSTGSTLAAYLYHWVHDHVGPRVQVNSTSGGTDVVGAFAAAAPTTPVWPGELSARALGVDLQAWDPDGRAHIGRVGELVVTAPMPSMPLHFVNDLTGVRYRDAYFSTYPGVWRHGDWVSVTDRGSVILHGRSDATLNRRGVRIGSAEIHEVVDRLEFVSECVILGVELGDDDYWMPMFVVPAAGRFISADEVDQIIAVIRSEVSPRHVPDEVIEVRALPHTKTGKHIEVPLKRILQGVPVDEAIDLDAVDDRDVLTETVRIGLAHRDARGARTTEVS